MDDPKYDTAPESDAPGGDGLPAQAENAPTQAVANPSSGQPHDTSPVEDVAKTDDDGGGEAVGSTEAETATTEADGGEVTTDGDGDGAENGGGSGSDV